VYQRYLAIRGPTDDGVDVEILKHRVESLERGKYRLAVVGETKAGKSTLINALLGERILATDVLQSSSAIVEIFKSDDKYLEVQFADGHTETVRDDPSTPDVDEAFEFLRKAGSLQDKFRAIPTTLIDTFIVDGRMGPGHPIPIQELEAASRLRLAGKSEVIEEYVRGRTLDKIPVEIRFGFPLKYAFDEFRIVDSPGVNALGGVQDKAYAYIHQANAVLFVHSIETPVESCSFHEFVTQTLSERAKETLFLILSKSGFRSEIEIEEKVAEAGNQFADEFNREHILHVDSMLKMVADDLVGFDSVGDLKLHYVERKKQFEQRYKVERCQEWREEAVCFDTKLRLLNVTLDSLEPFLARDVVLAKLRESSNYERMERAIEEFAGRAPEQQLVEILRVLMHGYENLRGYYEQQVELLERRRVDPQEFERRIVEIEGVLGEYHCGASELTSENHSNHTELIRKTNTELRSLHSMCVQRIGDAQSQYAVRKVVVDFNDECSRMAAVFSATVRSRLADQLRRLGAKLESRYSVTVLVVDLDGIADSARKEADRWFDNRVAEGDASVTRTPIGILFPVVGPILGLPTCCFPPAKDSALFNQSAAARYRAEQEASKATFLHYLRDAVIAEIESVATETLPSAFLEFVHQCGALFRSRYAGLIT